MKIYTKKGDLGETSLIGGQRVNKSEARLHAYGTVDELNSYIGLLRDYINDRRISDELLEIQDRLFTLGSCLASAPGSKMKLPVIRKSDIISLEKQIDAMNQDLPELKSFILPGGNKSVSHCHVARTICRRAERWANEVSLTENVDPLILAYLNRLSDYLFVLARKLSKILSVTETPWNPVKY